MSEITSGTSNNIITELKKRFFEQMNKIVRFLKLDGNDYAYKTISEYEEILGHKTNEAFRIGWDMARIKNKHLRWMAK